LADLSDPQMSELGDDMLIEDEDGYDVDAPVMRNIAMIGTAPSSRGLYPKDDPDWEVWGQADYWADMVRIDRWYEFAPMNKLVTEFPDYLAFLTQVPFPVYMRSEYEAIPSSVVFPFDMMSDKFGKEFMSATLVWMMCHAIMEHMAGETVKTIGLFGYDMALDGEYASQRPGIRHMEWICREHLPALGFPPISVLIPKGSDLSITPIPYPFAEDDPMVAKMRARKRDLLKRIAGAEHQAVNIKAKLDAINGDVTYLKGALENNHYYERMAVGQRDPAA
jgi:hypothetical protein